MIFDAREFLQTRAIYGGIIVVAVVFFVLEHTVIRFVESRTVERWGMVRESGTR